MVLTRSLGEKMELVIPGGLESVQMNQTSAYGLLVYLGKHNSRTVKNRVRIPNRPPMKDIWEDLFYHLENYTEVLVYQKPQGHWVKNFIISQEEKNRAIAEALGPVYAFKNKQEALDFWAEKEGYYEIPNW